MRGFQSLVSQNPLQFVSIPSDPYGLTLSGWGMLKIKFELEREESPYRPEFVEKIRQGDEDIKHGRGKHVTLEELDALWK